MNINANTKVEVRLQTIQDMITISSIAMKSLELAWSKCAELTMAEIRPQIEELEKKQEEGTQK